MGYDEPSIDFEVCLVQPNPHVGCMMIPIVGLVVTSPGLLVILATHGGGTGSRAAGQPKDTRQLGAAIIELCCSESCESQCDLKTPKHGLDPFEDNLLHDKQSSCKEYPSVIKRGN